MTAGREGVRLGGLSPARTAQVALGPLSDAEGVALLGRLKEVIAVLDTCGQAASAVAIIRDELTTRCTATLVGDAAAGLPAAPEYCAIHGNVHWAGLHHHRVLRTWITD